MMGWRLGYIAYPDFDRSDRLGKEFIKCQDTVSQMITCERVSVRHGVSVRCCVNVPLIECELLRR
jgi:aspartate/methionine/tyrosine aminotransferase